MPSNGNSAPELCKRVYAGAFAGAVDVLAEMNDADVRRLTQYGGVVGGAAQWLLACRAEQTETKRLVAKALREWREHGRAS